MNSQPYHPYNQTRGNCSSPNRGNYRSRNYSNTPPNWRSPPWDPRHNSAERNGSSYNGMKNNYGMMSPHNFNSPRNNMQSYPRQNSSYTSTPRGSQNSSFSSDSSGFIPLPFSPSDRFRSPQRGGNWSRGRRSQGRSFHEPQNCPVEMYYKKSMLEDPWKEFNLESSTNKKTSDSKAAS